MRLVLLRCPECRTMFGVYEDALEPDEGFTCPVCEGEVDAKSDQAAVT